MSNPTFLYCRPGSKLFKDEDIWETNINVSNSYDYYSIWTDIAEGHLNDKNSMFLLDGTNPRDEQLITITSNYTTDANYWPKFQEIGARYSASSAVNGNVALEFVRGKQLNEYNVFCIGIKRDDPNSEFRVFGRNDVNSRRRYLFYTDGTDNPSTGTSTYQWFTFFVTKNYKVVPLGSNNWY